MNTHIQNNTRPASVLGSQTLSSTAAGENQTIPTIGAVEKSTRRFGKVTKLAIAAAALAMLPAGNLLAQDAFIGIGGGFHSVNWENGPNNSYGGVTLYGGFAPFEHQRLSFDLGIFSGETNAYGSWKEDHLIVPILATWAYEFELSEAFRLHVGPTLGVTVISVDAKYRRQSVSDDTTVFTFGANLGATWEVTENFFIGLDYKFLGNSKTKFDKFGSTPGTSTSHQFDVSLGYRF